MVTASIALSNRVNRSDIPRVLVSIDYFNEEDLAKLKSLSVRAMLIDINYRIEVDTPSKHRQASPERRLNQRLKMLERRSRKESGLFWEAVMADEIAKRPRYYSIEAIKSDLTEIERALAEYEIERKPALSLDELENWLIRNSPFINEELDRQMQLRYQWLKKRERIQAMTPEERAAYIEKRIETDPIYKKAFENEAKSESEMLKLMEF